MSLKDLAVTMGLFTAAVVFVVLFGYYAFKKWQNREDMRRGRQIAMAHLDPECAELPKQPREGMLD